MNIVIVTQQEPFYIKYFFEMFLSQYAYKDEIKGVVIQKTLNQRSMICLCKKVFAFYGLKGFFIMGIKYILLRLADCFFNATGIQFALTTNTVLASHKTRILGFESVNSNEFLDFIKEEDISLVISVAASEIFKRELLQTPILGCVNMHSGPLPKYRGMTPNFWTLYNKEKYAWVTIHKMNEKLDDGPIICQDKFEIGKGESFNSLARRSKEFGADLMVKAINKLRGDNLSCKANDRSQATCYTFPTKAHIRAFRQKGGKIL